MGRRRYSVDEIIRLASSQRIAFTATARRGLMEHGHLPMKFCEALLVDLHNAIKFIGSVPMQDGTYADEYICPLPEGFDDEEKRWYVKLRITEGIINVLIISCKPDGAMRAKY